MSSLILEPNCEAITPPSRVNRRFEFIIASLIESFAVSATSIAIVVFAIFSFACASAIVALFVASVSAVVALIVVLVAVVATLGFLRLIARIVLRFDIVRRNPFVVRAL